MCGFVATFNFLPLDQNTCQQINSRISKRGPDGLESFRGENFDLFHSRLAIQESKDQDVQPYNVDKRFWLVYNGEIYNYRQLRGELERQGLRFIADGDTEVLARGLALEGSSFIGRLNGMFSFAFYDSLTGEVLLGRDRLGIKPLYYGHAGNGLVASTNLAAIKDLSQAKLDDDKLYELLNFRYELAGDGLYENINSLRPGHWAKWTQQKGLEVVSYWDLPVQSEGDFSNERFEALLKESIEMRTLSKVGITALMSAGVDSSFVALWAKKIGKLESVYTLKLKDNDSDVSGARKLCDDFSLQHHIVAAENAAPLFWADQWDEALVHLEAPVVDTIIGPTNLLFSQIAKKYKVVLSGEGADELLGGYVHLSIIRKIQTLTQANVLAKRALGRLMTPLWWLAKRLSPYPGQFSDYEKRKLASFLKERDPRKSYEILISIVTINHELPSAAFHEMQGLSIYEALKFDMKHWLPNYTLRRLDALSASYGVEGRVPYLDHRLVEMVMSCGVEALWGNIGDKAPLRAAHRHNFPAQKIWSQRKTPFVLSPADSLNAPLKDLIRDRLTQDKKRSYALENFCEKQQVSKLLQEKRTLSPLESKVVFSAYLTGRWLAVQS